MSLQLVIEQHLACCCCCDRARKGARRARRLRWRILNPNRWEYEETGPDFVYAAVSYWCPFWPTTRGRYFNERNFRGAPLEELIQRAHAWQNTEYTHFTVDCEATNPAAQRYQVRIIDISGFGFPKPILGRFASLETARQVQAAWMLKKPGYLLETATIVDLQTGAVA